MLSDRDIVDEMSSLKMLMAAIPGVPGKDYPILSAAGLTEISHRTGFSCPDNNVGGRELESIISSVIITIIIISPPVLSCQNSVSMTLKINN